MPSPHQTLSVLLLMVALPATANVTQLQLKNGDILTGKLQSQNADEVSLVLPYAGLIHIHRSDIAQIITLDRPSVETAQPAEAMANEVATAATIGSEVPREKPWSIELDVSASNRHGKKDSSLFNLTFAAEYNHQHWRTSFDSHFDYELKDQARKTHQYDVSPGLDYFISPRLFWRGSIDYRYNFLASDYRNLDFSTGPGYAVIQKPHMTLDLIAATGIKKAYFREEGEVSRFLLFGNQLDYKFSSLEWDFKYHFKALPLEIYSDGAWLHLLNQPIDFLYFDREMNANLGLRYKLTDKIRLTWSYQYEKTDIELRLPGLAAMNLDLQDFRQKLSIGASF
jgi:putative salt-induced outer membrane protein YdiY